MEVHEAKRRVDESLKLVRSVASATGNPALRGSLRIVERELTQVSDTILFIPFHKENDTALNLPLCG